MRKVVFALLVLAILVLPGANAFAATPLPWRDHAAPYSFLFGNHIDTHQQTRLIDGRLFGYFYIQYTGNTTPEGFPEAMHGDCTQNPDACVAGWTLQGAPIEATLISNQPGEHPTWCVAPAVLRRLPGYSHFHWLGTPEDAGGLVPGQVYEGYLLRLVAIDTFFFMHHHGSLVTPGIDTYTHANVVTNCD